MACNPSSTVILVSIDVERRTVGPAAVQSLQLTVLSPQAK